MWEDIILTRSFKKIFKKFLSTMCEYFFLIIVKTMSNELGNYAKRLTNYDKTFNYKYLLDN